MRLLPLGPAQAFEAVCNERTRHLVPEPLAHRIVAFLSSGAGADGDAADGQARTVEPALLSLFCRGVNEHRKRDGKARFDEALLEGGKETIVTDFYRTSLADQPARVRQFIAEELITEHGFRNSYSVDDALARGLLTADELRTLIDRHLLRQEHHLGTERVELTHDLLTRAVVEEREERRRADRGAAEQRRRRRRWVLAGAVVGAVVVVFTAVTTTAAWRVTRKALRAETSARERIDALQKQTESQLKDITTAADKLRVALATVDRLAREEKLRSEAERDRARSKELATLATTTLSKDPELAIALARAGVARADTPEARSALLEAAQYVWPAVVLDPKALGGIPEALALNADGSQVGVLAGGRLTLWSLSPRSASLARSITLAAPAASIAFSPTQPLLAVGGPTAVHLVEVATGRVARSWPQSRPDERRVVFSPDGEWLAWAEEDRIVLLDTRVDRAEPVVVPAPGVEGFAVVAGGRKIIGVTTSPLAAREYVRQPDGQWSSRLLSLSECLEPQSVSPGAQYVSASWKAQSCVYATAAGGDTRARAVPRPQAGERVTADLIWSAAGNVFVDILVSNDVIVGGLRSGESHVKGANPRMDDNDKSRSIAVSELGTRLALVDTGDRVKIYSLGSDKPLLSRLAPGAFAFSADGDWVAVVRRTASGEPAAAIDVIPTRQLFAPAERGAGRTSIRVAAPPSQIHATATSLVAVLASDPPSTVVFNAATGAPRFPPLVGQARVLGASGELLLLDAIGGQPARAIRVRDGASVTPWESGTGPSVFRLSPRREAVAILRVQPANRSQADALVYVVRGDRLVPTGQVIDLPIAAPSSPTRFQPADDGRSIVENRAATRARPAGRFVWPVTTGRTPVTPRPLRPVDVATSTASPGGRFEMQEESRADDGIRTLRVVLRADGTVLKRFAGGSLRYRFSSDDRWLGVWNDETVQVLDLERNEIAFRLSPGDISTVTFEGRNTLLHVRLDESAMLVPLDRALLEQFTTWLAPRALTARERCTYGLGGEDCPRDLVTR
jgi:hypothetical protein